MHDIFFFFPRLKKRCRKNNDLQFGDTIKASLLILGILFAEDLNISLVFLL